MKGLGPTHRFPQGRIHETDDGELRMAVGVSRRTVVVEFGKATKWIGFGPTQAREFAALLVKHAEAAERNADA